MRIGVLALQGAFVEHEQALAGLGVEPVRVRLPRHLDGLDGLILPGGESTAIGRLIQRWGLMEPIRALAQSGRPLWGTCAGLILLAREVGRDQPLVGVFDVTVERNAFGRQVDSFEADLTVPVLAEPGRPLRAVFIRAPLVTRVGAGVDILAHLDNGQTCTERKRSIVAVRQGHLLGTVFHPELTDDDRFHRYFLTLSSTSLREDNEVKSTSPCKKGGMSQAASRCRLSPAASGVPSGNSPSSRRRSLSC